MSRNVFFIINSLSYKSGSERVACHLANLFVEKLDYKVSILNRDTDTQNVAYPLNVNVKVYNLTGNYLQFYKKIQSYLKSEKPDFVIIHNMGRLSLLCSFLNLYKGKLISLEHVAFDIRPKWVKILSKIMYRRIDKTICLTYQDSLSYSSWFKDIYTIYNISPFLISQNKNFEKANKVIAIGRLTYQKNFKALLKAWHLIRNYIHDWELEIYGDGEERQMLEMFIDTHQIKNVRMMGQADNIIDTYSESSIFVMSSHFEGLPMVLIEAQTFGLPIVSFDCPHGPSEVINHKRNGLLVENQNLKKLAEAMLELIQDNEKRKEYSLQALKDAERFQDSQVLELWKNNIFEDEDI